MAEKDPPNGVLRDVKQALKDHLGQIGQQGHSGR